MQNRGCNEICQQHSRIKSIFDMATGARLTLKQKAVKLKERHDENRHVIKQKDPKTPISTKPEWQKVPAQRASQVKEAFEQRQFRDKISGKIESVSQP